VCTDFGATLAEFNGAQDHVHLLAANPAEGGTLPPGQQPQRQLVQAVAAGLRRQDQQGCETRQVLVTVILRQILRLRSAVHSPGLHHQPETTRPGKVSSLPRRTGLPPQITDDDMKSPEQPKTDSAAPKGHPCGHVRSAPRGRVLVRRLRDPVEWQQQPHPPRATAVRPLGSQLGRSGHARAVGARR